MYSFVKKFVGLLAIGILFFPLTPAFGSHNVFHLELAPEAGSCLCGVQDLTKQDSTFLYKKITDAVNKSICVEQTVQQFLDNTGKKLNVGGCVWKADGVKTGAEKAEAICKCTNKATGQSLQIKQDVSFTYPVDAPAGDKGKWFAIEGYKFCSTKTTAQQSCIFSDTVYGTGNIKSADTPLATYAAELNKLGTTDITEIIARFIKTALGVAGSIAFALFIYAGVMWMISSGNSDRSGKATQTMLWTTLGILIIFASYAIVSFIFEAVK